VHERSKEVLERGLMHKALGYSRRHQKELERFLEDGRLKPDNNRTERELRHVATGRKAWLFCGSDDHAQATGNLLSLIGSCRLHQIEPEQYLTDVMRVMPYWPRDRYLELSPKDWKKTRARLDPKELDEPYGLITVPPKETPKA
jgi:transposase